MAVDFFLIFREMITKMNLFDFNRASPSEFVIPLAKYNKSMYTQVSLGMRFRMMFETEESGVRRYMGTVTVVSDLDPLQWKNSQWRNLQVWVSFVRFMELSRF